MGNLAISGDRMNTETSDLSSQALNPWRLDFVEGRSKGKLRKSLKTEHTVLVMSCGK
jgi:hypothetical protein